MTRQMILQLLSQATGLMSAFVLYYASFGVKWEKQTWDGTSPHELAVQRRQKILGWLGVACAVVAVGSQTILTLWP